MILIICNVTTENKIYMKIMDLKNSLLSRMNIINSKKININKPSFNFKVRMYNNNQK